MTTSIRACVITIALSLASASPSLSAQPQKAPKTKSHRMADGKRWTTRNLDIDTMPSYCYQGAQQNCRQYGRLYPWQSAQRACQALGPAWRLPTDDEWRRISDSKPPP